jgi:hypothetical protein
MVHGSTAWFDPWELLMAFGVKGLHMRHRLFLIAACAVLGLTVLPLAQAPAPAVTRDVLLSYVGSYTLPSGETIRILLRGDHLVGIDPAGVLSNLKATSQTAFVSEAGGAIEFVKDEKGFVGHIAAAGGALDLKRVVVSSDILAKYVGTYPIPDGNLQITLEGGARFYQFTGEARSPMFAESSTKFFSHDGGGIIEFGFENGNPYLVAKRGGDELRAPRQQP